MSGESGRAYSAQDMLDPYFHEPLRLQRDTRHGHLWAYNPEVGRLPSWIKQARNRDEVLRGLDRMRASLAA
ncbi:hypothetical protein [Streptomyces sp. NPDC049555]|uniref:hypothetical protein n=1 Tax=unclassified Streptomyces TaxID=2593676 RepID=UPI003440835D